jgi:hypothetical protein
LYRISTQYHILHPTRAMPMPLELAIVRLETFAINRIVIYSNQERNDYVCAMKGRLPYSISSYLRKYSRCSMYADLHEKFEHRLEKTYHGMDCDKERELTCFA